MSYPEDQIIEAGRKKIKVDEIRSFLQESGFTGGDSSYYQELKKL